MIVLLLPTPIVVIFILLVLRRRIRNHPVAVRAQPPLLWLAPALLQLHDCDELIAGRHQPVLGQLEALAGERHAEAPAAGRAEVNVRTSLAAAHAQSPQANGTAGRGHGHIAGHRAAGDLVGLVASADGRRQLDDIQIRIGGAVVLVLLVFGALVPVGAGAGRRARAVRCDLQHEGDNAFIRTV